MASRLGHSLPGDELYKNLPNAKLEKHFPGGVAMYPSPLDRIRTGRRERAAQLGITSTDCSNSFDANQSFPKSTLTKHQEELPSPIPYFDPTSVIGKGIRDVSFNRPVSRGSFGMSKSPMPSTDMINQMNGSLDQSLNQSWIFYKYTSALPAEEEISGRNLGCYAINPNKAVVTINPRSTEILIANDMACELFGYPDEELIGKRLTQLLKRKHKDQGTVEELDINPETGDLIQIAGRIMEAEHVDGVFMSVSVWTNLIKSKDRSKEASRCVVVMEPVQKLAATITVSADGLLLTCDTSFVGLFGYQSSAELIGENINTLMPSIKLPPSTEKMSEAHRKQVTTGLSKSGRSFPISLRFKSSSFCEKEGGPDAYELTIWVFTSISGLVTVTTAGAISAVNEHFSKFFCGYSSSELLGKPITSLLPDLAFHDVPSTDLLDSGSIPLPSLDDDPVEADLSPDIEKEVSIEKDRKLRVPSPTRCDTSDLLAEATAAIAHITIDPANELERSTTADLLQPGGESFPACDTAATTASPELGEVGGCEACRLHQQNMSSLEPGEILDCSHSPTYMSLGSDVHISSPGETKIDNNGHSFSERMTSTPSRSHLHHNQQNNSPGYNLRDGCYTGHVQHKDGSLLGVIFQAKRVELGNGRDVNCLWISQDPEQLGEAAKQLVNLTLGSSLNQSIPAQSTPQSKVEDDLDETTEFPPADGAYRECYKTTLSVGKGAFGFVKLAQRRTDQIEFVVKFIRKSKVLKDCWVTDEEMGRVSLEISLLSQLDHPNIVKLVDVFENKDYFQLVMEKHGSGIDLFEFIEKNPNMDERLASYLFRQVVAAVSYLHNLSILHRDIKDENIILNEHFDVKLIDFGSSSFLQKGKLFSTFCGTIEYCSPEVLEGNKYKGPELEVWSMGVTLYTLIFGENPFYDVEETIQAVLKPPFRVSAALMQLIQWMLHPEPYFRARIGDVKEHKWITQPVSIEKYHWSDVLPNYEFKGNVAADNRPDPLISSDEEANSDDDDVRKEMIKVLNNDI